MADSGDGTTIFNTIGTGGGDVVMLGDVAAEALADENGAVYPVQKTADGAIAYVKDLPSKGYRSYTVLKEAMPVETPFVLTDDHHLETPYYRITLDESGLFTSIFDKGNDREVLKQGERANLMRM